MIKEDMSLRVCTVTLAEQDPAADSREVAGDTLTVRIRGIAHNSNPVIAELGSTQRQGPEQQEADEKDYPCMLESLHCNAVQSVW